MGQPSLQLYNPAAFSSYSTTSGATGFLQPAPPPPPTPRLYSATPIMLASTTTSPYTTGELLIYNIAKQHFHTTRLWTTFLCYKMYSNIFTLQDRKATNTHIHVTRCKTTNTYIPLTTNKTLGVFVKPVFNGVYSWFKLNTHQCPYILAS